MEEGKSAIKILIGESIGKRTMGRPSSRRDDTIGMHLKEIDVNDYINSNHYYSN